MHLFGYRSVFKTVSTSLQHLTTNGYIFKRRPTYFDSKQGLYGSLKTSGLRTSARHHVNPILALMLKTKGVKVLKGLSIVVGRVLRKSHIKLPVHVQEVLNRHRISMSIISVTFAYIMYYSFKHYDKCPLTGRRRWISFTKEQINLLADHNYKELLEEYHSKLLSKNSKIYKHCEMLAQTLIKCNSDLDIVKSTPWHLNVVDDDSINNAFVLPNGEIFVFTGMIKLMNSWEELAIVVGHEMAHAILGHTQEQQSFLVFGEILVIPVLTFIWFLLEDFAAFLVYTVQQFIYPLIFQIGFTLPFSRQLEVEADEVGLMLAAKACYDPRWSVLLWDKMALKEAFEAYQGGSTEDIEYISTHPSHQRRANNLESLLPKAYEHRTACSCPNLPSQLNPLDKAHHLRNIANNVRKRTELLNKLSDLKELDDNQNDKEVEVTETEKQLKDLETEYGKLCSVEVKEKNTASTFASWLSIFQGYFRKSSTQTNIISSSNQLMHAEPVPSLLDNPPHARDYYTLEF